MPLLRLHECSQPARTPGEALGPKLGPSAQSSSHSGAGLAVSFLFSRASIGANTKPRLQLNSPDRAGTHIRASQTWSRCHCSQRVAQQALPKATASGSSLRCKPCPCPDGAVLPLQPTCSWRMIEGPSLNSQVRQCRPEACQVLMPLHDKSKHIGTRCFPAWFPASPLQTPCTSWSQPCWTRGLPC